MTDWLIIDIGIGPSAPQAHVRLGLWHVRLYAAVHVWRSWTCFKSWARADRWSLSGRLPGLYLQASWMS